MEFKLKNQSKFDNWWKKSKVLCMITDKCSKTVLAHGKSIYVRNQLKLKKFRFIHRSIQTQFGTWQILYRVIVKFRKI